MQCSIYELFQEVEHHGLDLEMESVSASDYSKEMILKLKYRNICLKIANHHSIKNISKLVWIFFLVNLPDIQKLSRYAKWFNLPHCFKGTMA